MIVSLIAALVADNRGIGYEGGLPWQLPRDLARFRRLTMGHAVVFGRTTYESLGGRPLPGRQLIVLTRREPPAAGVRVASSLEQALDMAAGELGDDEPFIGGGGQVFAEALARGLADRMYLTLVHGDVPADTFFPEYPQAQWRVVDWEEHPADAANPLTMTFQTLLRIDSPAGAFPEPTSGHA